MSGEALMKQAERQMRDLVRRLTTLRNVLRTAVNSTDPDTIEGRKARLQLAHVEHQLDELAGLVDDDGAGDDR